MIGESLSSACLQAVLIDNLAAPILFVWIRREAGSLSAWSTVILFGTSPFVVEVAQFTRFYCLQMLFFTVGAIGGYYAAAANPICKRTVLAEMAMVSLALSFWMQVTATLGLIGIGAWVIGAAVLGFRSLSAGRRAWRVVVAALLIVGNLLRATTMLPDKFIWAWRRYRTISLFAAGTTNNFCFHHLR